MGGILLIVYIVLMVFGTIPFGGAPSLSLLFSNVGYILVAVCMLGKQRNLAACAGFLILALQSLWELLTSFSSEYFGFFDVLFSMVNLAGCILLLISATAQFTDFMPQFRKTSGQIWLIPVLCFLLSGVRNIFSYLSFFFIGEGGIALLLILRNIVKMVALAYTAWWIAEPGVSGVRTNYSAAGGNGGSPGAGRATGYAAPRTAVGASALPPEAYCGMVKHILLLLFTCGIWYLIWIYRTTEYLNCVKGEPYRNPVTQLLLCMFIPFYGIYWTYKSAQRIDQLAAAKGLPGDSATLCLILAIFIPIIAPMLMQDKINNIITSKGLGAMRQAAEVQMGAAQELKKYKELLDAGVITQEEFDAKKKQLLGL